MIFLLNYSRIESTPFGSIWIGVNLVSGGSVVIKAKRLYITDSSINIYYKKDGNVVNIYAICSQAYIEYSVVPLLQSGGINLDVSTVSELPSEAVGVNIVD